MKRRKDTQWQGMRWENWGQGEWQILTNMLNSRKEFCFLTIQYPFFKFNHEEKQWYEIPRWAVEDPYWYQKSAIQRATYHEGLLSIFLSWEAGFSDKKKQWIWIREPTWSGDHVNAIDFDTLSPYRFNEPYQPRVVETSHGDLLRVGNDTIAYPEYSYKVDPIVKVEGRESYDGTIYGGKFIVPSDFPVPFPLEQVFIDKSVKRFQ